MKKLEATNAEQQQQAQAQAQTQATTTALTEAQLAAAAYCQAQFMLLANSLAASAPTCTTDNGTGATTVDSSALSEYYQQCLGYVWNDRTPTSSDAEDAGTPLPSDKEDEKEGESTQAGEILTSSDKPSEVKLKDKRSSKGERERHKIRRSRKHKLLSAEGTPSPVPPTEIDTCRGVQKEGDGCHKLLSGQVAAAVVGNDHGIRNSPDDIRISDRHQSDSFVETPTITNTCTHPTTDGAGLVSEEKGCRSPPRENPSHRENQRTKEPHRMAWEPHREMRDAQREDDIWKLRSNPQSPTNSCIQESVNDQCQCMEESASIHDMKVDHSKGVNHKWCSSNGKQPSRRQRRDREKKEMQREMKRESTDVQGWEGDSYRENHIKRSRSSSQSPHSTASENVNDLYQSNILDGRSAPNTDTKVHTRANGISHHTPRIEKHSPKRYKEDRETNKSCREWSRPHGEEVRQSPRESRRTHRDTREEYAEMREGHRETKDTHRTMVEPHRDVRETNRERREMHKEMKEPHRAMIEPPRVRKDAHGDTRETFRRVRETHRETTVAYKGISEPRRETHRETMEAYREPHRSAREPQAEIHVTEPHRDRRMAQRETREAFGDREGSHDRRSHSSSRLSSSSRHRSRSPSYDKENIRRPPSLSRERQPREEPLDTRSGRANSLERTNEDISSRRRRLNRKRKLSSSSQSANQHDRKQTRRESYRQDIDRIKKDRQHGRSSVMSSHDSSPKQYLSHLASPVPGYDDIMTPPTPNADEILPYCTDIKLCENSALLSCDGSGAKRNMSDVISCPPTPTSELKGQDEEEETSINEMERKSSTKDQENGPQANLNSQLINEKTMELKDRNNPDSCLDGGDNPLASENNVTVAFNGSEPTMENVGNEDMDKKEVSDLEEGEITDSDSDSGNETESTTRKEANDHGPRRRVERREVNISGNCRSHEVEKRAHCEQLVDEMRPRWSSSHGSGGYHRHQRHSPRRSHHPPLSERRNRHSPPSLKKRTELCNEDNHVTVKHSRGERHTQCDRSSRHLRSNLPEHVY